MAEEDLIFGKNRHMFGGIEPSNMTGFSVAASIGNVKLKVTLPSDTIINGQTLCTVAGAVIRRRTDDYPIDEFDGDLVADVKTSGTITDTSSSTSDSYYYAAFPYTTQGVYNRNPANRLKYNTSGSLVIYGYDLDTANSDPEGRVTYPSDVTNVNFTPAKMNFTGTTTEGTFSYGSWPSTPGSGFMPRPCMLSSAGVVVYYLNPNDYTKKENGEASDYNNLNSYTYNAMMEWPKIYTKRELVDGIYKFRCSLTKIDESWECWCNYDINNNEIDHFYTSIYKRSIVGGPTSVGGSAYPIRSISGQEASGGTTLGAALTNAKNNLNSTNNDWSIEVLSDHLLIQDLLVMMARTTDLKSAYGDGWSETAGKTSGGLETKGLFYGAPKRSSASTQTGRVKIFGMEDYWDSQYSRRIAGLAIQNGTYKVKLTRGTKDGSTVTDYNDTGNGYITLSGKGPTSGGYISACSVNDFGRLPTAVSGANTTYECDYANAGSTSMCFALIGGIVTGSVGYGPFGLILNREASYTSNTYGASISYKPRKT